MPSSYTSSLRLTLPVTGENSSTWGDLVNTGITNLVDASVAGYAAVTMTDADYTLTTANGTADEARKMLLNITGTLTTTRNVICPTVSKLYFIKNATTGGFAITLKTSAGTGISVPNGKSSVLMCDGTNVVEAVSFITAYANVVTNVTATSPVVSSGGTTPVISMPAATASVNGYMTSTFATKLNGITAGAAVASVSGTSPVVSSGGTTPAISMPAATASVNGYMTSTFAAKLDGVTATVPGAGNFGYLNIPQNSQSTNYTLVLSDAGKHILHPTADATARVFTIPDNSSVAWPIGTAITIINQFNAGNVTITPITDIMRLAGTGIAGSRVLSANGIATIVKVDTTQWLISGINLS